MNKKKIPHAPFVRELIDELGTQQMLFGFNTFEQAVLSLYTNNVKGYCPNYLPNRKDFQVRDWPEQGDILVILETRYREGLREFESGRPYLGLVLAYSSEKMSSSDKILCYSEPVSGTLESDEPGLLADSCKLILTSCNFGGFFQNPRLNPYNAFGYSDISFPSVINAAAILNHNAREHLTSLPEEDSNLVKSKGLEFNPRQGDENET